MERWGEVRAEPEGHLTPEVRGQECLLKLLLEKPGSRQVSSSGTHRNIYPPCRSFRLAGQLQPDGPKMSALNDRPPPAPALMAPTY